MAHYKSDIIDIDLNTGNINRNWLNHCIGQKDDDADRFGIRAFRDGVPVDLSGASCHAWFLNSQGTTIALTSYGTVDGNEAYVTLPPACYDYEGKFTLAIKIVGGGVSSTVRIVDGMVDNINVGGAVTPTSAVPTYSEILSQYDAMVAATSAANLAIAEEFDATKTYPAGKNVINSGALYLLPEGHTANTTWANTTKVASNLGDQVTDLESAIKHDEVVSNLDFLSGRITNSGDTVDINTVDSSTTWVYCVIPCSAGDEFEITGEAATSYRLWSFISNASSNNMVFAAGQNATANNLKLVAPYGSSYLVINTKNTVAYGGFKYDRYVSDAIMETDCLEGIIEAEKICLVPKSRFTTNVNVGSSVSLKPVSTDVMESVIVDCSAGDVFVVTGTGGDAARLYAFVDSSNNLVEASTANKTLTKGKVITPTNAVKALFCAINSADREIIKGYPKTSKLQDDLTTLTEVVNSINPTQICILRKPLYFDTVNRTITIPIQRIVVGTTQIDITNGATVSYPNDVTMGALIYSTASSAFRFESAKTGIVKTTDYIAALFYTAEPQTGFCTTPIMVNNQYGMIPTIKKTIPTNTMENGINEYWSEPMSIRYTGMRDKTYVGFVDSYGNQGVMSYDHTTGEMQRTILRSEMTADEHNCPAVQVLDDGKIMCIMTEHNTTEYHYIYISKERESVSEFEEPILIPQPFTDTTTKKAKCTYSQIIKCGGKWWLMWRMRVYDSSSSPTVSHFYHCLATSEDGTTWSEGIIFADGADSEATVDADNIYGIQLYVLPKVYDSNTIKLYVTSNAASDKCDIRLGYINCTNGEILNADKTTVLGDLDSLESPIPWSSFNIIVEKETNRHIRLLSVGLLDDMSVAIARFDPNGYSNVEHKYCRYNNGSFTEYDFPYIGSVYGSYVQNHIEIIERDRFMVGRLSNSKWWLTDYTFADGSISIGQNYRNTPNEDIKIIRPFKVEGDNSVSYNIGYRGLEYTDYYMDVALQSYA